MARANGMYKKHNVKERKRLRKLHLAAGTDTHGIVGAQMTLSYITDGKTLKDLIRSFDVLIG